MNRILYWTIVFGLAVVVLIWWTISSVQRGSELTSESTLSIVQLVSEDDVNSNFSQVIRPAHISFPADHGPHVDFRTEWWYFTGNLSTADKADYGYQFTIFRRAVSAEKSKMSSDWATNQIYMAHVALTDAKASSFYSEERFNRGALGMAGAQPLPFSVWLDDWVIEGRPGSCEGCLDIRMEVAAKEFALALDLTSLKPAVLHGDSGYSRKGVEADNASYYYSLTRIATTGHVELGGKIFRVSGTSWMDHEWFTSVLNSKLVGWNWFSVQFEDNREIMFFQLRNEIGDSTKSFEEGTLVHADGKWTKLSAEDVRLTELRTWKSEESGSEYPVSWQMDIPKHNLSLSLHAVIDDQERIDSVKYWEGAINVIDQKSSNKLIGKGYLEMTGY